MKLAERAGATLREATADDLPAIDELTIEGYAAIQQSYVALIGDEIYEFMFRHVLDHFRGLGLRFAHVDTGLDDAHVAARRAYEAVGFDRQVPGVEYWQDLLSRNPGSTQGELLDIAES